MNWFLNLFPQYRALQKAWKEAAETASRLQDQNFALTEQINKLTEENREAREAQVLALKAIANIQIQVGFGGIAPYPEAYSLPKQVEHAVGPVPTNRVQGRDMVRAGIDEFKEQIKAASSRR